MTLASFFNLLINSSTDSTFTPPALTVGGSVFTISKFDFKLIPKVSIFTSSKGFCLA